MDVHSQIYEDIRLKHNTYVSSLIQGYVKRLSWSRTLIEDEQKRALRSLIKHAKSQSSWYKERLADIDPLTVTVDDLKYIQPTKKEDLMLHWDNIVTSKRITLKKANDYLVNLKSDAYFMDKYHVIASGGSTGKRGVFLYDWHGWAISYICLMRGFIGYLKPGSSLASLSAYIATHATSSLAQTFSNSKIPIKRLPVTLPLMEIIEGLNQAQPSLIHCYPSILPSLCAATKAGKLNISPQAIWCTSEPLLEETRALAKKTWGAPVLNSWSSSEVNGGTHPCTESGLHISEDIAIIETVDREGNAVPPGVKSNKIYITNLYNLTMPFIRYEITDEFTMLKDQCSCGSYYQKIADVSGRSDDIFDYNNNISIHPHNFRSPLGKEPAIIEYQVHQTENGADISLVLTDNFDFDSISHTIKDSLVKHGLTNPVVNIQRVNKIERLETGKLKRFVPLM